MARRVTIEHKYVTEINKSYGASDLFLDLVFTFFSGGVWLLWIPIREWRNRSRRP